MTCMTTHTHTWSPLSLPFYSLSHGASTHPTYSPMHFTGSDWSAQEPAPIIRVLTKFRFSPRSPRTAPDDEHECDHPSRKPASLYYRSPGDLYVRGYFFFTIRQRFLARYRQVNSPGLLRDFISLSYGTACCTCFPTCPCLAFIRATNHLEPRSPDFDVPTPLLYPHRPDSSISVSGTQRYEAPRILPWRSGPLWTQDRPRRRTSPCLKTGFPTRHAPDLS